MINWLGGPLRGEWAREGTHVEQVRVNSACLKEGVWFLEGVEESGLDRMLS